MLNVNRVMKSIAAATALANISQAKQNTPIQQSPKRQLGSTCGSEAVDCEFVSTSQGYNNNRFQDDLFNCAPNTLDVCRSGETLSWMGTTCNAAINSQNKNVEINANYFSIPAVAAQIETSSGIPVAKQSEILSSVGIGIDNSCTDFFKPWSDAYITANKIVELDPSFSSLIDQLNSCADYTCAFEAIEAVSSSLAFTQNTELTTYLSDLGITDTNGCYNENSNICLTNKDTTTAKPTTQETTQTPMTTQATTAPTTSTPAPSTTAQTTVTPVTPQVTTAKQTTSNAPTPAPTTQNAPAPAPSTTDQNTVTPVTSQDTTAKQTTSTPSAPCETIDCLVDYYQTAVCDPDTGDLVKDFLLDQNVVDPDGCLTISPSDCIDLDCQTTVTQVTTEKPTTSNAPAPAPTTTAQTTVTPVTTQVTTNAPAPAPSTISTTAKPATTAALTSGIVSTTNKKTTTNELTGESTITTVTTFSSTIANSTAAPAPSPQTTMIPATTVASTLAQTAFSTTFIASSTQGSTTIFSPVSSDKDQITIKCETQDFIDTAKLYSLIDENNCLSNNPSICFSADCDTTAPAISSTDTSSQPKTTINIQSTPNPETGETTLTLSITEISSVQPYSTMPSTGGNPSSIQTTHFQTTDLTSSSTSSSTSTTTSTSSSAPSTSSSTTTTSTAEPTTAAITTTTSTTTTPTTSATTATSSSSSTSITSSPSTSSSTQSTSSSTTTTSSSAPSTSSSTTTTNTAEPTTAAITTTTSTTTTPTTSTTASTTALTTLTSSSSSKTKKTTTPSSTTASTAEPTTAAITTTTSTTTTPTTTTSTNLRGSTVAPPISSPVTPVVPVNVTALINLTNSSTQSPLNETTVKFRSTARPLITTPKPNCNRPHNITNHTNTNHTITYYNGTNTNSTNNNNNTENNNDCEEEFTSTDVPVKLTTTTTTTDDANSIYDENGDILPWGQAVISLCAILGTAFILAAGIVCGVKNRSDDYNVTPTDGRRDRPDTDTMDPTQSDEGSKMHTSAGEALVHEIVNKQIKEEGEAKKAKEGEEGEEGEEEGEVRMTPAAKNLLNEIAKAEAKEEGEEGEEREEGEANDAPPLAPPRRRPDAPADAAAGGGGNGEANQ